MNINKIIIKENMLIENFERFKIINNSKKIDKNGINARILFILVFFDVKTFKP